MTKGTELATESRLESLLSKDTVKKRFEEVLGKKAPGFISSVISAYKGNDLLSQAEPMSVLSAAMVAASLDLPINSNLGFAHIVPYKTDGVSVAQFQMGWKGFVQLAIRSGQYNKLNPFIIYEGQLIKWDKFKDEMEFRNEKTSDKVWGYVLYFRLNSGFEKYFVMTREEVEAHAKRYSQAYKKGFGPWKTDFDSMALKTVTKLGLSKFGVLSIEMNKAVDLDEGVIDEEMRSAQYVDAPAAEITEAQPTSKRLTEALEAKVEMPKGEIEVIIEALKVQSEMHGLMAYWKTVSAEAKEVPEIAQAYMVKLRELRDKK